MQEEKQVIQYAARYSLIWKPFISKNKPLSIKVFGSQTKTFDKINFFSESKTLISSSLRCYTGENISHRTKQIFFEILVCQMLSYR